MQDDLEFATPRIHNPIYEFSNGCYDKDSGTFVYDPRLNQPLNGATTASAGSPPAAAVVAAAAAAAAVLVVKDLR